jgi:FkbM family methyltransferase
LKCIKGVWLPDHEEHLIQFADKEDWTYQKHKMDAAIKLCRKTDVVVDVGGHCGIWAKELAKVFGHVHSFEPVPEHRDCYGRNQKAANFTLYPYAFGHTEGVCSIRTTNGSSGDSWITEGTDVEVRTLDSFNLAPDLIKVDCEGSELFVLMGAIRTLALHKPALIIEQKPGHAKRFGLGDTDAIPYLQKLGYTQRGVISGDFLFDFRP